MSLLHKLSDRIYCKPCHMQARSQPHSFGWARVPLSSFFPQISINFFFFSSNLTYFLHHFGPPDGRLAHPGKPWQCHWSNGKSVMSLLQKFSDRIYCKPCQMVNQSCHSYRNFLIGSTASPVKW